MKTFGNSTPNGLPRDSLLIIRQWTVFYMAHNDEPIREFVGVIDEPDR
jgi:hypothetical protein